LFTGLSQLLYSY